MKTEEESKDVRKIDTKKDHLSFDFQSIFRKKLIEKNIVSKNFFSKKEGSSNNEMQTLYDKENLNELIKLKRWVFTKRLCGLSREAVFEIDLEKLHNFLVKIESEIVEEAVSVYENQIDLLKRNIDSSANDFANNWKKNRENFLQNLIDEKDLTIKAGISELEKRDFENNLLTKEKMRLEKKIFSKDLDLSQENNFNLEKTSSDDSLILKLKSKIAQLDKELEVIKFEKSSWNSFYQSWYERKEKYEERRKEQEEIFNEVSKKNFVLACESDSLKYLLLEEKKNSENLRKEINEKDRIFEFNDDLISKLKKEKSVLKVKLFSLLAFDTSRNFLPNKAGDFITYVETFVFNDEINSGSNKTVWNLIAIFFVYSIILGIKGIFEFFSRIFSFWKNHSINKSKKNL